MSRSWPAATWTSSGSPNWRPAGRADRRLRRRHRAWRSAPGRSSTAFPGGAFGGSTSWSGTTPMRDGTANPHEAPIKVAGPKSTWPGKKQVSRIGEFREDVIHLEDEAPLPDGRSLLQPVLRGGEFMPGVLPSLGEIRERAAASLPRAARPITRRSRTRPNTRSATPMTPAMRQHAIEQHGNGPTTAARGDNPAIVGSVLSATVQPLRLLRKFAFIW